MTRVFVICASLLGLSACGGDVGLAMLAASTATFIHTDKTVIDHAVGLSTDREHGTWRYNRSPTSRRGSGCR